MSQTYTAMIQKDGRWWIGWVQEIAGVNAQARTRKQVIQDLQSALGEAIEMNRSDARSAAIGNYEEVALQV